MTKAKAKRKPASRANDSKIKSGNSVRRKTARKAINLKPDTEPAARQQPKSAPQPTARRESKKAHIIAMLRAPDGATIGAMARATKWQLHSVRGAADSTPCQQKGSPPRNVASARWRDYRGDGTCSELAAPFGPRLPRCCRAQEARPHSCLGRRRERARLPYYGSHGVSSGAAAPHAGRRRRQPEASRSTTP